MKEEFVNQIYIDSDIYQTGLFEKKLDKPIDIALKKESTLYLFLKRTIDIVFSVLALIILSPVFLIIVVAIKLDSKGPAFYSQERAGKNNKTFKMWKFRSMCTDADSKLDDLKELNERDGPVFKISNDPRVTKVGKFLRRTSLDELPQFFNILLGHMSIVGPRPPLVSEVLEYQPHHMHRLSVKPGLTCYWQISGRSDVPFEQWVELDLKYIRESNIWVDFKIMIKTIPAVISGKGAY